MFRGFLAGSLLWVFFTLVSSSPSITPLPCCPTPRLIFVSHFQLNFQKPPKFMLPRMVRGDSRSFCFPLLKHCLILNLGQSDGIKCWFNYWFLMRAFLYIYQIFVFLHLNKLLIAFLPAFISSLYIIRFSVIMLKYHLPANYLPVNFVSELKCLSCSWS
jgi:hypothetical protein